MGSRCRPTGSRGEAKASSTERVITCGATKSIRLDDDKYLFWPVRSFPTHTAGKTQSPPERGAECHSA